MVTYKGKTYEDWAAARAAMAEAPATLAEPDTAELPMPAARLVECPPVPKSKVSLTEKYRPKCLAEIVGQPDAVDLLRDFAAEPYSWAFILAGETGTGKTSAAYALATELGCNLEADPPEFGGVYSIQSGEHSAESVRAIWPKLWSVPFDSELGWKVVIVNEVEQLSAVVERIWLDRLEDLPPRTVIIFTTNAIQSLPARFQDRCTVIPFESGTEALSGSAARLVGEIWRSETGRDCPAGLAERIASQAGRGGNMSFRRVVQNIVPALARERIRT